MSDFDADEYMRYTFTLTEPELTGVLTGESSLDRSDLRDLASFCAEVRTLVPAMPDAMTEQRHLSAISDEVARSRARRTTTCWPTRMTAASVVFVVSFGGAAFAGALPPPVQHAVANAAGKIGLSLPGQHGDVDDGPVTNIDNGQQGNTDTSTVLFG